MFGGAAAVVSLPTANHIVVIVADDLGHADLGYAGSDVKTPTIDALAADGVKLTDYYVQRACSPTRAALLTGRYNIRYGMQSGVLEPGQRFGLSLNEQLLPEALRAATAGDNGVCGASTFSSGWNCDGAGLPGFSPVSGATATSDPATCCALCKEHADCDVWTIYSGSCFLKRASCTPVRHGGATSGGNQTFNPPPPSPPVKCPPAPPPAPGSWATHIVGKWCAAAATPSPSSYSYSIYSYSIFRSPYSWTPYSLNMEAI